jgi:glucose/arabinose dehydrogenase
MIARHRRHGLCRGHARAIGLVGLVAACAEPQSGRCSAELDVPADFCAELVADDLGPARHLVVSGAGDIYVALWREGSRTGGLVALRDTNGDGRADVRATFGPEGGSGVALARDSAGREFLFFGTWSNVYRWALTPGQLVPSGPPDLLVEQIPELEHGARSVAVSPQGELYVNVGAPSNACERDYPRKDFRGADPCEELRTSGGVWRFADVLVPHPAVQRPEAVARFATGLRHTVALAVDSADGSVYGAPHGIDHLRSWWPDAGYTADDAAQIPAEVLFRLENGRDYGFPYCMYDPTAARMVLAPAYGGSRRGTRSDPRCGKVAEPLAQFPAHAAPSAIVAYRSRGFPSHYERGLFVALHGSLFRAPLAPSGYAVMFIPRRSDGSFGTPERFAATSQARRLIRGRMRPSGLAVGPDGSLFVSDDAAGHVWRIRVRR